MEIFTEDSIAQQQTTPKREPLEPPHLVTCPICGAQMSEAVINKHMDSDCQEIPDHAARCVRGPAGPVAVDAAFTGTAAVDNGASKPKRDAASGRGGKLHLRKKVPAPGVGPARPHEEDAGKRGDLKCHDAPGSLLGPHPADGGRIVGAGTGSPRQNVCTRGEDRTASAPQLGEDKGEDVACRGGGATREAATAGNRPTASADEDQAGGGVVAHAGAAESRSRPDGARDGARHPQGDREGAGSGVAAHPFAAAIVEMDALLQQCGPTPRSAAATRAPSAWAYVPPPPLPKPPTATLGGRAAASTTGNFGRVACACCACGASLLNRLGPASCAGAENIACAVAHSGEGASGMSAPCHDAAGGCRENMGESIRESNMPPSEGERRGLQPAAGQRSTAPPGAAAWAEGGIVCCWQPHVVRSPADEARWQAWWRAWEERPWTEREPVMVAARARSRGASDGTLSVPASMDGVGALPGVDGGGSVASAAQPWLRPMVFPSWVWVAGKRRRSPLPEEWTGENVAHAVWQGQEREDEDEGEGEGEDEVDGRSSWWCNPLPRNRPWCVCAGLSGEGVPAGSIGAQAAIDAVTPDETAVAMAMGTSTTADLDGEGQQHAPEEGGGPGVVDGTCHPNYSAGSTRHLAAAPTPSMAMLDAEGAHHVATISSVHGDGGPVTADGGERARDYAGRVAWGTTEKGGGECRQQPHPVAVHANVSSSSVQWPVPQDKPLALATLDGAVGHGVLASVDASNMRVPPAVLGKGALRGDEEDPPDDRASRAGCKRGKRDATTQGAAMGAEGGDDDRDEATVAAMLLSSTVPVDLSSADALHQSWLSQQAVPAERVAGGDSGPEACPVCCIHFGSVMPNADINKHIDDCLTKFAIETGAFND